MNFFTHAERHTEIQNRLTFSIVRSQRARPLGDKGNVADMTLTYGERPIWPEVIFKFPAPYFFVFTARCRVGTTVRQISHTVPSHACAEQCSRP